MHLRSTPHAAVAPSLLRAARAAWARALHRLLPARGSLAPATEA